MQVAHALLGRRDADDRRVSRFGTLLVRAGRLTDGCRVSDHIEQVVLNLKCKSNGRGEAPESGLKRR